MKETDWFPLTHCPIHPGVYKTLHLASDRRRIEGYSRWLQGKGWSYTEETPEKANRHRYLTTMQSKQWKGLTEAPK